ncbi:MAG: flagellar biosynthetic protein FliP, partial [Xanthomonadaceae bacterium]|nr:flagellar biosynthetic protein FliP [Xanthomonadaceae bacterium]
MKTARWIFAALLLLLPLTTLAAVPGIPVLNVQSVPGGGQSWTLSLQVLALMTALTLLPAIVLMMTSFTRIIIVLGFLRQALGT